MLSLFVCFDLDRGMACRTAKDLAVFRKCKSIKAQSTGLGLAQSRRDNLDVHFRGGLEVDVAAVKRIGEHFFWSHATLFSGLKSR